MDVFVEILDKDRKASGRNIVVVIWLNKVSEIVKEYKFASCYSIVGNKNYRFCSLL